MATGGPGQLAIGEPVARPGVNDMRDRIDRHDRLAGDKVDRGFGPKAAGRIASDSQLFSPAR